MKGAPQKHIDEEQQDQVAMAAALQCFHAQAEMFAPRFKDEQVSNQTVAWGKVSKGDDRQLWIEGDQTPLTDHQHEWKSVCLTSVDARVERRRAAEAHGTGHRRPKHDTGGDHLHLRSRDRRASLGKAGYD